jgi:hypothetical protein
MAQEDTQYPLDVPAFSIDGSVEVIGSWTHNHLLTPGTLIEAFLLHRLVVPRIDTALAHLVDFGDSSVDFELRIWVSDPQQALVNVASKVWASASRSPNRTDPLARSR